jgi:hypothetical protein
MKTTIQETNNQVDAGYRLVEDAIKGVEEGLKHPCIDNIFT